MNTLKNKTIQSEDDLNVRNSKNVPSREELKFKQKTHVLPREPSKKKKRNILKWLLCYKSSDTNDGKNNLRSAATPIDITMTNLDNNPNLDNNDLRPVCPLPEAEKPNLTRRRSHKSHLWQKVHLDIMKAIKKKHEKDKTVERSLRLNERNTTIKESSISLQSLQPATESIKVAPTIGENTGKILLKPLEEKQESEFLSETKKTLNGILQISSDVSANSFSLPVNRVKPTSTSGETKEKEFNPKEQHDFEPLTKMQETVIGDEQLISEEQNEQADGFNGVDKEKISRGQQNSKVLPELQEPSSGVEENISEEKNERQKTTTWNISSSNIHYQCINAVKNKNDLNERQSEKVSRTEGLKSTKSEQKAQNSYLSKPHRSKKKKRNILKWFLCYNSPDIDDVNLRSVETQTDITMTCAQSSWLTSSWSKIPKTPISDNNDLREVCLLPKAEKPAEKKFVKWTELTSHLQEIFKEQSDLNNLSPSDLIKAIKNYKLEGKSEKDKNLEMSLKPNKKDETIKASSIPLQSHQPATVSIKITQTIGENGEEIVIKPEEQQDSNISSNVSANSFSLAVNCMEPTSASGETKEEFNPEEQLDFEPSAKLQETVIANEITSEEQNEQTEGLNSKLLLSQEDEKAFNKDEKEIETRRPNEPSNATGDSFSSATKSIDIMPSYDKTENKSNRGQQNSEAVPEAQETTRRDKEKINKEENEREEQLYSKLLQSQEDEKAFNKHEKENEANGSNEPSNATGDSFSSVTKSIEIISPNDNTENKSNRGQQNSEALPEAKETNHGDKDKISEELNEQEEKLNSKLSQSHEEERDFKKHEKKNEASGPNEPSNATGDTLSSATKSVEIISTNDKTENKSNRGQQNFEALPEAQETTRGDKEKISEELNEQEEELNSKLLQSQDDEKAFNKHEKENEASGPNEPSIATRDSFSSATKSIEIISPKDKTENKSNRGKQNSEALTEAQETTRRDKEKISEERNEQEEELNGKLLQSQEDEKAPNKQENENEASEPQ